MSDQLNQTKSTEQEPSVEISDEGLSKISGGMNDISFLKLSPNVGAGQLLPAVDIGIFGKTAGGR